MKKKSKPIAIFVIFDAWTAEQIAALSQVAVAINAVCDDVDQFSAEEKLKFETFKPSTAAVRRAIADVDKAYARLERSLEPAV